MLLKLPFDVNCSCSSPNENKNNTVREMAKIIGIDV